MTERLPTPPPTGMRDVLPDEVELRDLAAQTILRVYRSYGFRRIETPALEHLRLLTSGEGGENEKLIYKVMKRGDDLRAALERGGDELADLGLRFDLTVPLVRYYANNHARLPNPLKAIQIGPVWRAERPQKGRFRQFTQCDIDVLGLGDPIVDVELILATSDALVALGLASLTVRINDRRILSGIARACGFAADRQGGFFITFDKLDKIGRAGVVQELRASGHDARAVTTFESMLDVLDPKTATLDSALKAIASTDPDVTAGAGALTAIVRAVDGALPPGSRLAFDPTLVRGMGYYTGPIFEISAADYPSSIAGGGRYDRMIGRVLGRHVPASGFSIGFERLISILEELPAARASLEATTGERVALVVDAGDADLAGAVGVAQRLRREGHLVSLEVRRKNWKRQAEELAAHGFSGWVSYNDGEPWRVRSLARPDGGTR